MQWPYSEVTLGEFSWPYQSCPDAAASTHQQVKWNPDLHLLLDPGAIFHLRYDLKSCTSAERERGRWGSAGRLLWFVCRPRQITGAKINQPFILQSTYLNPVTHYKSTRTWPAKNLWGASTVLWLLFSKWWDVTVRIESLLPLANCNPTTLSFNLTSIIFWDCPFPLWCLKGL